MIRKIYLPYHKLLIGLVVSFIPIYFQITIVTVLYVVISSILITVNGNVKKAIIFYLILAFLLPYDFIHLATNNSLGLIFNEYFIAGLPLYLLLPKVIIKNPLSNKINNIQKIILISSIIILTFTNIIPGFANLLGLGGHKIRLIFLFNFINALILFYFLSTITIDNYFIKLVSKYFILLGFLLALSGIIQFLFKISIVPNYINDDFSRLYLFSFVNPVDCIPFLLVPLVISLNNLFYAKKNSLLLMFICLTILFAIFLTWSRWAVFTVALLVIIGLWLNRKQFIKKILIGIFIFALLSPIFITLTQNALKSDDQQERLNSASNLYVRAYLWGLGLTAIIQNPIFGYGFGNSIEAMFSQESKFNPFEQNSDKSVSSFQNQSVHQFFLDYLMSLGVLFLIPLSLMFYTIMKTSLLISKDCSIEIKSFYYAIFLSAIGLFVFWLQNVGPQMFYLFAFLGLMNYRK